MINLKMKPGFEHLKVQTENRLNAKLPTAPIGVEVKDYVNWVRFTTWAVDKMTEAEYNTVDEIDWKPN